MTTPTTQPPVTPEDGIDDFRQGIERVLTVIFDRVPRAELSPEQIAADLTDALSDELDRLYTLDAQAAAAMTGIPAWEAVYEPGNVSDYLIGYTNSAAAAKGAAIGWLQSESDNDGTRLEWVEQPQLRGGGVEFELITNHDDGIPTTTGIVVRHRPSA